MRDALDHVAQQTIHYFLGEEDQDSDSQCEIIIIVDHTHTHTHTHTVRPSLPRLGIQLINNSPRVQENTVEVDFILTRPASSVSCQLGNEQQQDCTSNCLIIL